MKTTIQRAIEIISVTTITHEVVLDILTSLLPAEREQIEAAYHTGQNNGIAHIGEDISLLPAEGYFTQTFDQ